MKPRYVVFGEALTDFVCTGAGQWRSAAGGACWNVARSGARLGIPTAFAGAVSVDGFGDDIAALSAQAGLDLRFLQRVDRPPLLAMVTSTAPPTYFFVGADSADLHFDPQALPQGWMDDADIVHFGSISLARQPLAARLLAIAARCHAAGKRIAFDPNWRAVMDASYQATLQAMARLAHYIKVSDEDLQQLFPGLDEQGAMARLRQWAPEASIMLTRGARGLELHAPHATLVQPALRVNVADTIGCGDASMAGWMASLLTAPHAPPQVHAAYAAASAAVAAQHAGAYPPCRAEVEALLARRSAVQALHS
jgi:fructokinase